MKKLFLLAAAVILFTAAEAAHATCTNSQSYCLVGPPLGTCTQLIYDTQFSEWNGSTCTAWAGSGWTSYHVNTSGDDYWEILSWGGSVEQQFTIPANSDAWDVNAVIYLAKNSVGSERIRVQVTNTSGTVLQTLGTWYASSSGTTINVSASPTLLAGQTVRLRFQVSPGSTPGDTEFQVTQAYVRALDYP